MTQLALYEHAREALTAAVSFDEVTRIRTQAEQAKAYARIAKDRKLMADAQEIVARAERKLGILLRKVKGEGLLSQGGRPAERSNLTEPETGADAEPVFDSTPFTLAELGISKKLSSRAQQLAELDEGTFETTVSAAREKILAEDAAVVSPPKTVRAPAAPKPESIRALPASAFHRFTFAVLALSLASDRVSSEALQSLAEHCRILERDGDAVDFTLETIEAFGSLAAAALRALDVEDRPAKAEQSAAPARDTAADGGDVEATAEQPPSAPLSTEAADAVIRDGYAAVPPVPVVELAAAIGRPGNRNYVKNRARVMGLSSRARQREIASAFTSAQHAARRDAAGEGERP